MSSGSTKKRQYQDEYIQYGFTSIVKNDRELPQCVICFKVLSADAMKPSLLKRHLSGCHSHLVNKDIDYFKRKEKGVKTIRLDRSGQLNQQVEAGLRASFLVALKIAKEKKPHNIGENLILPCCKDIVRNMIGDEAANKLNSLPLSNNTIQRRIGEMADDIKEQVVKEIRDAGKFSIQLDETTDVNSCAQLLVFARYIKESDFKDEFLFCHPLESTTKGEDVFNAVSTFFQIEGLSWDNVCACTTDGAPAMIGYRSGFRSCVSAVNASTKHLHCMIHRYALASKTLPPELKEVLDDVVSMVNAIKSSALNTRLFRLLCQDLDENHEGLIFHTEIRWLSRGNVVSRVESLKEEMAEFFNSTQKKGFE